MPISYDAAKLKSREYALHLDATDDLASFRDKFMIPTKGDLRDGDEGELSPEAASSRCIYLCGNSLGLQTKRTRALIQEELEVWSKRGVLGHFKHPRSRPWVSIDENVVSHLAGIVGALPSEVAVMGSLTANIHLLMASFYKPTKERYRIIIESKAFPSDHFAVESQVRWHGFDAASALVTVTPEGDKSILSTERILEVIGHYADSTALLFLSGVQYYTGQAFDINQITKYAQSKGIVVGWDLAHAAGNIPLQLHEWGIDFAAWCSYKYLCSGPGGIAGIFVHDKHGSDRHRLAGWWGHDKVSRFQMETVFKPLPGAAGYQLSNPSVLDVVALLGSVELFTLATPHALQQKSIRLTGYLWHLLHSPGSFPTKHSTSEQTNPYFRVITPSDDKARGAQLSIMFLKPGLMPKVFKELINRGIVVDERNPDVIRVAPVPLYNTYSDVYEFVHNLKNILEKTEIGEL